MASRIAALLLLGVICLGFASGQVAIDCCLSTSNKHFPHQIVKSYIIQEAGKGCEISATILKSQRGKNICAPEASKAQWVQDIINHVDKRRARQYKRSEKDG
ncbi:C-C motif chemokine 21-like [Scomber scombrus]|uniref:C-C motif chemokine 21-like n=1 Tax=Scomber scombrus TaxID=13677 RepID=UPI002DD81830|nr:C-C motif chemokine 21-like [Scomber scombrus]